VNVRRIAVVVGFWVLLVLALVVSDAQPAVLVLAGVVAAIGTAVFVVFDLADAVDEVEWTRRSRRPASLPQRTDPRVSALRRKAQGTWWSSSSELGDTLVELIDDRLLAHHHVDRSADPAAASAVLTPALRSLVTQPRRSSMSPRELDQLLSEIEAL
jgi:hypothetical protein